MPPINLHGHCLLFALVVLCTAWTTVSVQAAEFLPDLLIDDPRPQTPFAHEVEVTLRPVTATQVLGEEMPVILSMRNLSRGMVRLPHQWGDSPVLMAFRFTIDPAFVARHGITIRELNGSGIGRFQRLRPDETSHAVIRLDCYLTFANPIHPPIPITWKLWLRNGEEKGGHFLLHIQFPQDPLDEVMEQLRRKQDKYLPSMIELPEVPTALTK